MSSAGSNKCVDGRSAAAPSDRPPPSDERGGRHPHEMPKLSGHVRLVVVPGSRRHVRPPPPAPSRQHGPHPVNTSKVLGRQPNPVGEQRTQPPLTDMQPTRNGSHVPAGKKPRRPRDDVLVNGPLPEHLDKHTDRILSQPVDIQPGQLPQRQRTIRKVPHRPTKQRTRPPRLQTDPHTGRPRLTHVVGRPGTRPHHHQLPPGPGSGPHDQRGGVIRNVDSRSAGRGGHINPSHPRPQHVRHHEAHATNSSRGPSGEGVPKLPIRARKEVATVGS